MVEKKGDSVGGGEPNPNRESQQEYFGVRAGEPTKPKEPTFKDFFGGHFSTAPYSRPKESLLEQFAKDPAVAEILRTRTRPSVGRREGEKPSSGKLSSEPFVAGERVAGERIYRLSEDLLPAGEEVPMSAPILSAALAPAPTFTETWEHYKAALYDIHSAVGLAISLLRDEGFRTPVGGRSWETLHALAVKAGEISEALRGEIAAVPEGNGLVE